MRQIFYFTALVLAGFCSLASAEEHHGPSKLECLNGVEVEMVRGNPDSISDAFVRCREELARKTDHSFSDNETRAIFASVIANAMAPYGNSMSFQLSELLRDKHLDCDNYAALTAHFIQLLVPDQVAIDFVGFDGGAIGNHAQLFVSQGASSILLDPTIGLAVRTNFDDLLQAKKPEGKLYTFRQHDDVAVDAFRERVEAAAGSSLYKPSDLLYFFHGIDAYVRFAERTKRYWDAKAVDDVVARYPTPASEDLKNNLEQSWRSTP